MWRNPNWLSRWRRPATRRQRALDVEDDQDPLAVADVYGRPIAIVRLGSKAPGPEGYDETFLFGSPELQHLDTNKLAAIAGARRVSAAPHRSPSLNNPGLRKISK